MTNSGSSVENAIYTFGGIGELVLSSDADINNSGSIAVTVESGATATLTGDSSFYSIDNQGTLNFNNANTVILTLDSGTFGGRLAGVTSTGTGDLLLVQGNVAIETGDADLDLSVRGGGNASIQANDLDFRNVLFNSGTTLNLNGHNLDIQQSLTLNGGVEATQGGNITLMATDASVSLGTGHSELGLTFIDGANTQTLNLTTANGELGDLPNPPGTTNFGTDSEDRILTLHNGAFGGTLSGINDGDGLIIGTARRNGDSVTIDHSSPSLDLTIESGATARLNSDATFDTFTNHGTVQPNSDASLELFGGGIISGTIQAQTNGSLNLIAGVLEITPPQTGTTPPTQSVRSTLLRSRPIFAY